MFKKNIKNIKNIKKNIYKKKILLVLGVFLYNIFTYSIKDVSYFDDDLCCPPLCYSHPRRFS
jgi:hypothetical protein